MDKVRVRFAPSPTGPFHIGGARSALFNFLFARKYGGKLILRIEDTDRERSSRESEQDIMNSMRWLGIDWDEGPDVGGEFGPYRQMERLPIYEKYVEKLFDKGYAYYCYCTEEELEAKGRADGQWRNNSLYRQVPGFCQDGSTSRELLSGSVSRKTRLYILMIWCAVMFPLKAAWRFCDHKVRWDSTYNFAVVVDDHEMDITHVIRAEDTCPTRRDSAYFEALDITPPEFAHISLILGKDRSKMSKRHGATSINQYMEMGYLPEALINFLALLGWAPEGEEEVFSMEELIASFSLDRVSKSPAVFDLEKLQWLNGLYIRSSSIDQITDMALPYYQKAGYASQNPSAEEYERLKRVTSVIANYLNCLSEIPQYAEVFFKKILS